MPARLGREQKEGIEAALIERATKKANKEPRACVGQRPKKETQSAGARAWSPEKGAQRAKAIVQSKEPRPQRR